MANANETSPAKNTCCHCDRPAVPAGDRCRCCTLEAEASEAFWAVIARHFPEATSGDLSPERTVRQNHANLEAIEEWIRNNVPQGERNPLPPAVPTKDAVSERSAWPSHAPWTAEVMTHGKDAGMYQVVNSKGWVIAQCMVREEAQNLAAVPELMNALDDLLRQTVDRNLAEGVGLTADEQKARRKALAALKKANASPPRARG